jgi:hypothetical protein
MSTICQVEISCRTANWAAWGRRTTRRRSCRRRISRAGGGGTACPASDRPNLRRTDPKVVDRKALDAAVNALSENWKPRRHKLRSK